MIFWFGDRKLRLFYEVACFFHEVVVKSSANSEEAHRTVISLRLGEPGGAVDRSDKRRIIEQH